MRRGCGVSSFEVHTSLSLSRIYLNTSVQTCNVKSDFTVALVL